MTTDQVWVEIDDTVSIGVERDEAMSLDRNEFVELYKRTVYPPPGFRARRAWKRDAEAWADKQIADRGSAPDSEAATPRRPEDDALAADLRLLQGDWPGGERWRAAERVREALERLREERDAAWFEERRGVDAAGNPTVSVWCRRCGVEHQRPEHCPARPESAEAEVRRLTEGLRAYMEDHQGIVGAPDCECRLCETARALLSANPPQGDAAEGSSPSDGGGAK